MKRKEVIEALIEILKEVQKAIGEEPEEINEKTRPIGGIGFFDSLVGIAVTFRCFERFGIEDDGEFESLFHGNNKKGAPCAFTVGEVADRIMSLTNRGD